MNVVELALISVGGLVTAAAAAAACLLVPARVRRQPVPVDVDAENLVLETAGTTQHDDLAAVVSVDWFTSTNRRSHWITAAGHTPGLGDDEAALAETLDRLAPDVRDAVIAMGVTAEDRELYQGAATLETTGDDDTPYRWQPATPGWRRLTLTAVIAGVIGGTTIGPVSSTVGWLGVAALLVWLVTGVVLAWVDVDTLFIDLPVAAIGYGTASIAAAAASWAASGAAALVSGVTALVASALFVGFVVAYSRLRGISGMGGGDFMILPALVAVPLWLGAAATSVAWGIVIASVVAIATWLYSSRGRSNRLRVPFPYGPALIVGFAAACTFTITA